MLPSSSLCSVVTFMGGAVTLIFLIHVGTYIVYNVTWLRLVESESSKPFLICPEARVDVGYRAVLGQDGSNK